MKEIRKKGDQHTQQKGIQP